MKYLAMSQHKELADNEVKLEFQSVCPREISVRILRDVL